MLTGATTCDGRAGGILSIRGPGVSRRWLRVGTRPAKSPALQARALRSWSTVTLPRGHASPTQVSYRARADPRRCWTGYGSHFGDLRRLPRSSSSTRCTLTATGDVNYLNVRPASAIPTALDLVFFRRARTATTRARPAAPATSSLGASPEPADGRRRGRATSLSHPSYPARLPSLSPSSALPYPPYPHPPVVVVPLLKKK